MKTFSRFFVTLPKLCIYNFNLNMIANINVIYWKLNLEQNKKDVTGSCG